MAFLSELGVTLPATVRLGGHSVPRTRTNVAGPNVGFVLVRALEAAVRAQPGARIVTGAKVGRPGRQPKSVGAWRLSLCWPGPTQASSAARTVTCELNARLPTPSHVRAKP
jgi:hypothetical protein